MTRIVAALAAFVFVVAACTNPTVADVSPSDSADGLRIFDFIPGVEEFGSGEQIAIENAREQAQQQAISDCMAEQGFVYIPVVQVLRDDDATNLEAEREYAAQYGFGISTAVLADLQRNGSIGQGDENDLSGEHDPNDEIVQAMGESERNRYEATLYGPELDIDFSNMTQDEIDAAVDAFEFSGCEYDAFSVETVLSRFNSKFGGAMDDATKGLEFDPRIVSAREQWPACMAEGGYEFQSQTAVTTYIFSLLESTGAVSDIQLVEGGSAFEIGEVVSDPQGEYAAAVAEVAAAEVAVAIVVFGCNERVQTVRQQVYVEAEQAFVVENLKDLERFRLDNER
ncbi:MAG: hypothetical protein GXP34_02735 [Actinobacteria bacterium]|nr:hypothetical protein [Actinomycetota bacterium]